MANIINYFLSSRRKLTKEKLQELTIKITQLENEIQSLANLLKENAEKFDVIIRFIMSLETDQSEKTRYTSSEIAELLGISSRTVCTFIKNNALKGVMIGRQYIVESKDFEDFKARYQKR